MYTCSNIFHIVIEVAIYKFIVNCTIFCRSSDDQTVSQPVFDKESGNFIVMVEMSPDMYGCCAQQQIIADIDRVQFKQDSGKFVMPVFMTPQEYGSYLQDNVLPRR